MCFALLCFALLFLKWFTCSPLLCFALLFHWPGTGGGIIIPSSRAALRCLAWRYTEKFTTTIQYDSIDSNEKKERMNGSVFCCARVCIPCFAWSSVLYTFSMCGLQVLSSVGFFTWLLQYLLGLAYGKG